ncbi:MAG: isopentenyl-diphosphate Delta-isomerase [Bacteroidia bacterium]
MVKEFEEVILVDENDRETGRMEKLQAHHEGKLHRAFSVFIFNSAGELLLQKRAHGKYHSAGLWTNTCCSHPRSGENTDAAANRRLHEEMGIYCGLKHKFAFIYRAELENGLIEHELDHVYTGVSNDLPNPDPAEVDTWKYLTTEEIEKDMQLNPSSYTAWFKLIFPRIKDLNP